MVESAAFRPAYSCVLVRFLEGRTDIIPLIQLLDLPYYPWLKSWTFSWVGCQPRVTHIWRTPHHTSTSRFLPRATSNPYNNHVPQRASAGTTLPKIFADRQTETKKLSSDIGVVVWRYRLSTNLAYNNTSDGTEGKRCTRVALRPHLRFL